jgi:Arc/MetJ family transcription regulator
VTKTLIDLDDALLQAACALLGTRTATEAVNAALREVVARDARRRDADWLRTSAVAELADPTVRGAAWGRYPLTRPT